MRDIVTVHSFKDIKAIKFRVKYFDANFECKDESIFMEKKFDINDDNGRGYFITELFKAMYYADVVAIKLLNQMNAIYSTCFLHIVDDINIEYTNGTATDDYSTFVKLMGDVIYGDA